jgi:DNA-binding transcriptional ArsR family regulator
MLGMNRKPEKVLEKVWKALADPTRRSLLDLLRERPRTTGELCARFTTLSRFAVMKHLRVLEETRLVTTRKDGRMRWNHLNVAPIHELDRHWMKRFKDLRR